MKTSTVLLLGVVGVGAYFVIKSFAAPAVTIPGTTGGASAGNQVGKTVYTNDAAQVLDAIGNVFAGIGSVWNQYNAGNPNQNPTSKTP